MTGDKGRGVIIDHHPPPPPTAWRRCLSIRAEMELLEMIDNLLQFDLSITFDLFYQSKV